MNNLKTDLRILIVIATLVISCNQPSSIEYATPAVYFVEFDTSHSASVPTELIQRTIDILVSNDYVLTEESGRKGWPFYLSLPRGTKFPKDSLAPPHTTIHILECEKKISLQPQGQTYKVIAAFDDQVDEMNFNLTVEIQKMDSLGNLKKLPIHQHILFQQTFQIWMLFLRN